jgi:glycosyltransferase involved in cell wall biosynthesis
VSADTHRLRIVTPRYGLSVIGGAESVARSLAHRLVDAGWDVEVWTTCAVDAGTWRNQERRGADDDGGVRVLRFANAMRRWPALFAQVSRVVFRCPPRLRPERLWMVLQGPYSPSLVRAIGVAPARPTLFLPYLYHPTVRGLPRSRGPRLLMPAAHDEPPLHFRVVARTLARTDGLLYATPEERRLLESAHHTAAALPATVGSVGIEAPADADAQRFRTRFDLHGPYLLYGGRDVAGKGMELLVDGMRQLRERRPGCRLVLTGDAGTGGATLNHPDVVATGRLERTTLWDALSGATAVVVPSRLESLSLLALEAWAVGRPALLNSSSPALAGQARRSGAALLFGSADELAEAAARLIDDDALAGSLGRAGRDYVRETYSWPAMLSRFTTLVESATAYHRGRTDTLSPHA